MTIYILMRESQVVPWDSYTNCTPICAYRKQEDAESAVRKEEIGSRGTSDRFYIQECEIV